MTLKKLLGVGITFALIVCNSVVSFANEKTPANNNEPMLEVDFSTLDLKTPFEIKEEFVNEKGETETVGVVFTPDPNYKPELRWSETYDATVGTWTSYYDGIAADMSYDFDLSKSGSHWKISNPRGPWVSVALSSVSDKKLVINRAISAPSYLAEIMGSCTIEVLDVQWGQAATIDAWIKTTVSDSGTLKVSGN